MVTVEMISGADERAGRAVETGELPNAVAGVAMVELAEISNSIDQEVHNVAVVADTTDMTEVAATIAELEEATVATDAAREVTDAESDKKEMAEEDIDKIKSKLIISHLKIFM